MKIRVELEAIHPEFAHVDTKDFPEAIIELVNFLWCNKAVPDLIFDCQAAGEWEWCDASARLIHFFDTLAGRSRRFELCEESAKVVAFLHNEIRCRIKESGFMKRIVSIKKDQKEKVKNPALCSQAYTFFVGGEIRPTSCEMFQFGMFDHVYDEFLRFDCSENSRVFNLADSNKIMNMMFKVRDSLVGFMKPCRRQISKRSERVILGSMTEKMYPGWGGYVK
ncbi:hypothetical protein HOD08_02415 [bacterium]|nr:hypothetical protein [bacterium]